MWSLITRVIEAVSVARANQPAGARPPHCRAITNQYRPGEYLPYQASGDAGPASVVLTDQCPGCGDRITFRPNNVRICGDTAYLECAVCAAGAAPREDDARAAEIQPDRRWQREVARPQYETAARDQIPQPCTCPTCHRVLEAGLNFFWATIARNPEIYHTSRNYTGISPPLGTDLDPRIASPQYFECDKCREHYLCSACGRHFGKRSAKPIADDGRTVNPEWRRSARESGQPCPACSAAPTR
jgi:hypothetical protein